MVSNVKNSFSRDCSPILPTARVVNKNRRPSQFGRPNEGYPKVILVNFWNKPMWQTECPVHPWWLMANNWHWPFIQVGLLQSRIMIKSHVPCQSCIRFYKHAKASWYICMSPWEPQTMDPITDDCHLIKPCSTFPICWMNCCNSTVSCPSPTIYQSDNDLSNSKPSLWDDSLYHII